MRGRRVTTSVPNPIVSSQVLHRDVSVMSLAQAKMPRSEQVHTCYDNTPVLVQDWWSVAWETRPAQEALPGQQVSEQGAKEMAVFLN